MRVLRSMLRPDAAHAGASTRTAFEDGLRGYVAASCGKLTPSVCTLGSWLFLSAYFVNADISICRDGWSSSITGVRLGNPLPVCYLGTSGTDSMFSDDVTASLNQLERELASIVKATVDSTLGRLGTVGASAVDEFIGRLKSAMQEVSNAGVAQAGSLGGVAMELPMTPTRPSVGSVICPGVVSISSRQGSLVPSASGDGMFMGPSSGFPNTTATNPGKQTHKIMSGVFVIMVFIVN